MPAPDIDQLLSELTLEEKISLVAGIDWWKTAPVPRLGIPSLKFSDGPNGARGAKFTAGTKSACFPAAVSLAATFDRDAVGRVGRTLAGETKTKGASVLLAPTVCIPRDPRGGRNFEAFSEDPFLTGELASAYIAGLQDEGVGASLKHFCLNEEETYRYTMDVIVDERTLREIYLKPFEIAVKKARPWAVMTSYNNIDGVHADAHRHLLEDVLRRQWGFRGMVISDWGGTNSCAAALYAGLDLEMPGPAIQRSVPKVTDALHKNELSEETLDARVRAVLSLVSKAGKFDSPDIPDEQAIDLPSNRKLIRETSVDGMVLLKNNKAILPLNTDSNEFRSIALIGLAKEYLGHGGGSAQVNSHRKITPYDAFEEALQGKDIALNYAEGARIVRNLPAFAGNVVGEDGKPGFTLQVTTPATGNKPLTYNVPSATFVSREHRDATSVSLTGTYTPPVTGNHYISFTTVGNTTVYINDEEVFRVEGSVPDIMAFMLSVAKEEKTQYRFVQGQEYRIRIAARRAKDAKSGPAVFAMGVIGMTLGFMYEQEHDAELLPEAITAAANSDVAIVFVGHTPVWETEGCDRETIDLPRDGSLDALISAVAKANPRTIVVNSTGSPITMPWLADVSAVLQAWLPGQEAGYAISDVILGKASPGGKLPVTFPKSISAAPTYGNFPGDLERRRVEYKEEVFMGYRHYDEHPDSVLFPFGHGLSYSRFQIDGAQLGGKHLSAEQKLDVTVTVTNVGLMAGSEVVQVYAGEVNPSLRRPVKELAGFSKVRLLPGESKKSTVTLDAHSVAYWNVSKHKWSVDAGQYRLFIGNSSVDITTTLDFSVETSFEMEV